MSEILSSFITEAKKWLSQGPLHLPTTCSLYSITFRLQVLLEKNYLPVSSKTSKISPTSTHLKRLLSLLLDMKSLHVHFLCIFLRKDRLRSQNILENKVYFPSNLISIILPL